MTSPLELVAAEAEYPEGPVRLTWSPVTGVPPELKARTSIDAGLVTSVVLVTVRVDGVGVVTVSVNVTGWVMVEVVVVVDAGATEVVVTVDFSVTLDVVVSVVVTG